MAYRKNFLEEEAQKNVAQGAAVGQNTLSPRSTTGQSAEVQAGQVAGAGPGANAPQAGASPTGYIPLQQYLQANVGAGAGVKNILGKQVESTKTAAEQEYSKAQADAAAKAKEAAAATEKAGQQIVAGVSKTPVDTLAQAKDFMAQGYAGPEATPYTAQIGAAKTAAQTALGGLETEAGRQAALEKNVPGYARYGALDRFLFAQDPNAKAAFEAEQAKAKEAVSTKAGTAESAVGTEIKTAKDKLAEQQKAIKEKSKEELQYRDYLKRQERIEKNRDLQAQEREGARQASLGDVVSQQELADLEALSSISGENLSDSYRQKTYAEGQIKPKMVKEETRGIMVPESEVVGYDSKGRPITEWERTNVLT